MEKDEQWIAIKGFVGYEISSRGKVRNDRGHLLKLQLHSERKYYTAPVRKNRKATLLAVHRLVAEHFLPNPNEHLYIEHENGDLLDNRVENLCWSPEPKRNSQLSQALVQEVKRRLLNGEIGAQLALEYNTSEMSISRVNKKLTREISRSLKSKEKKRYFCKSNGPVYDIEDINWFNFVQESLDEEQKVLSAANFMDLAIDYYGFYDLDRLQVAHKLTPILDRLCRFGILLKHTSTNRQRLLYGFAEWFTSDGYLREQYAKTLDRSVVKRMHRVRDYQLSRVQKYVYALLNGLGHACSEHDLLSMVKQNVFIGLSSRYLKACLHTMIKLELLNSQRIGNTLFVGLPDWWFKNGEMLKKKFSPKVIELV